MRTLRGTALACLLLTAGLAPAGEKPAVDLYGDPLPDGAVARLGTVRWKGRCAHCLAFSRDGKLLAAGNSDMTARLWDTATGREVARFHGNQLGEVQRVALSVDGNTLATLDADGAVRFWDAQSGKQLRVAEERFKNPGDDRGAAFAFSPDGRVLYVRVGGSLRAITAADGKSATPPAPPERGLAIDAVSPDGAAAVSAPGGGRLVVWDLQTGKSLGEVIGPRDHGVLALSPQGKRLAVATKEAEPTVVVYDVTAGKELSRCKGHQDWVSSLAFAPDGKALASGSGDLTARLWDVESGKERWSYHAYRVTFYWVAVAFAPDGRTVGAAGWDGIVRLLDAETGKERLPIRGHFGWVNQLAPTPDGKAVFTSSEDQSLRLWDVSTGKELRVLKEPAVDVYDPQQRNVVHSREWVYCLDLAADGKALAVGDARSGKVWDLSDPDRYRASEHTENGCRIALSPDGRIAVTVTAGRTLRLLDLRTKQVLHEGAVAEAYGELRFSPDGRTAAVGCSEGSVRLFDVRTWQERAVLRPRDHQAVSGMAFSPDAQLLATGSGDGRVHVWEVASGQPRRRIERKESRLDALAFSPDGRTLAVGGTDGNVCVHDMVLGRIIHTFRGHDGWIPCLAFTPDGRRLISGSHDTTALVWDMTALPAPAVAEEKRTEKELTALWERLAGDAETADAAMRELAACPTQAADLIGRSLKPVEMGRAELVARLVRDLDADSFAQRERASAALEELGEDAAEALRKALAGEPSPEQRRRAEKLLGRLQARSPAPEQLRELRAVQVLEWAGTPAARRVLEALAAGEPGAELTRAAEAALACSRKR